MPRGAGGRAPAGGDPDLFEADPGRHAAREAVPLAHALKNVHHLTVHQAKIACVHRDTYVGDAINETIEKGCAEALEPTLSFASGPDGVDESLAVLLLLWLLGNGFRSVLVV